MKKSILFLTMIAVTMLLFTNCNFTPPKSSSGVEKMTVGVKTNEKGHTVEQENIAARYTTDNAFGAIKHLYVISAYSGQVILYSTVTGKVTSSGKRLTPTTISGTNNTNGNGFGVLIGDELCWTQEVLQDDGTYGTSDPYIYWFDSRGIYHQHYMTGGQIIHVSDQPLSGVKSVIINIESR